MNPILHLLIPIAAWVASCTCPCWGRTESTHPTIHAQHHALYGLLQDNSGSGKRTAGIPGPNPYSRTQHTHQEFDPVFTTNHMKGRYQLPVYAKFNRPDPQRNRDWYRPNTINLYQYCGNDPINCLDPNGFGVVGIKLATTGKNKVDVSRFPILKTLASPDPQELGFKDEKFHKNYLINIQAQLEPGDDPSDFVVEQSAIAASNDGITSALEGEDSPEEYAVAYDSNTQVLSMVDTPGLSEVGFGHG